MLSIHIFFKNRINNRLQHNSKTKIIIKMINIKKCKTIKYLIIFKIIKTNINISKMKYNLKLKITKLINRCQKNRIRCPVSYKLKHLWNKRIQITTRTIKAINNYKIRIKYKTQGPWNKLVKMIKKTKIWWKIKNIQKVISK